MRSNAVASYLRVSVDVPGGSIEAGLQRSRGEPLRWLRAEMRRAIDAADLCTIGEESLTEDNGQPLTDALELEFSRRWPNRTWFVELWLNDEALTRVDSRGQLNSEQ